MKIYKINFKSHLSHLWPMFFLIIFEPIMLYCLIALRGNSYNNKQIIIIGIVLFCITILPLIVLHINHYLNSKNSIFGYEDFIKFTYKKNKVNIDFNKEDVESLISYKSYAVADNRTPVLPWDIYNYSEIRLKNGDRIRISSLLINELDKKIKFENAIIKKTIYAWIGS